MKNNPTHTEQPLRILLVEDDVDTLKAMTYLLRLDGHHVDSAKTIEEAERKCQEGGHDLLISDIELPDGFAYELIKENRGCHGIKAIVVSGHGLQEHVERSKSAGYKAHLVKPLRFDQLRAAVLEVARS
jgi:DNA-binding response OmpR family regulator